MLGRVVLATTSLQTPSEKVFTSLKVQKHLMYNNIVFRVSPGSPKVGQSLSRQQSFVLSGKLRIAKWRRSRSSLAILLCIIKGMCRTVLEFVCSYSQELRVHDRRLFQGVYPSGFRATIGCSDVNSLCLTHRGFHSKYGPSMGDLAIPDGASVRNVIAPRSFTATSVRELTKSNYHLAPFYTSGVRHQGEINSFREKF